MFINRLIYDDQNKQYYYINQGINDCSCSIKMFLNALSTVKLLMVAISLLQLPFTNEITTW